MRKSIQAALNARRALLEKQTEEQVTKLLALEQQGVGIHHSPNKKYYEVGDETNHGSELEKYAYEAQYLYSECRPVRDLIPLWRKFKKLHHVSRFEDWLLERNKCRKDDYHLGEMLGHDFVPHVHHEMCLQYVQKNFDGVY